MEQVTTITARIMPPSTHTQAFAVANHLNDRGSISFIEALHQHRITSLTKVMSVLQNKYGWNLRKEWREDETGKRYVRYYASA